MRRLPLLLALLFMAPPAFARPAPHVTGYAPVPIASATPQALTVRGSSFTSGVKPSIGTASHVTDSSFTWTVTLPVSGSVALNVTNADGKRSNTITVTVLAPPPPPVPACTDPAATNAGQPLPCTYPPPAPTTCTDPSATNVTGPLPCTYPPPPPTTCADATATNFGGPLPCLYSHTHLTVTWDYTVADSFDIRYGTSPGVYNSIVTIPGDASQATLNNLVAGQIYYVVMRATVSGQTSSNSNEASGAAHQ